jgi:hypothetical protein
MGERQSVPTDYSKPQRKRPWLTLWQIQVKEFPGCAVPEFEVETVLRCQLAGWHCGQIIKPARDGNLTLVASPGVNVYVISQG